MIAKYSSFVRSADMQTDLSVDVTDERSTPSCETFGPVPSSGRKTGRADGAALRPQLALRAAAWNRVATSGEVRRSNATQTLASSRYVIQAPAAAAMAVGDGRRNGALPAKAADDALHIAIAATNGVPFLLTWNCRHMANAAIRPMIEAVCAGKGLRAPIICTPEELLEPNS